MTETYQTDVTAWMPVWRSLRVRSEELDACILDLIRGMETFLKERLECVKDVSIRNKKPNKKILSKLRQHSGWLEHLHEEAFYHFLEIRCSFSYAPKDFRGNSEATPEHLPGFACCDLSMIIPDCLLVAALAYPGRIRCATGAVFWRDFALNYVDQFEGISYSSYTPKFTTTFEFSKVADWIEKTGLFDSGYGDTPLTRALASFSHLAGASLSASDQIFRALQGLEALVCDGGGNRFQLTERLQLLLGEPSLTKKRIQRMYDVRSLFVHGKFPIERWNNNHEMDNKGDKADRDLRDCGELSTAMLIGAIHQCILRDCIDLKFESRIAESPSREQD